MNRLQLSLRSILLVLLSIATLLGTVYGGWHDFIGTLSGADYDVRIYVLIFVYVFAWMVPAASLGYDKNNSNAGISNGASIGAVFCVLSMFLLNFILPDVQ